MFLRMAKKKFYAVQSGRNTGVYSTWAEAQAQVNGYPGAVFKKFDSSSSAQSFADSNSGYSNFDSSNSYGSSACPNSNSSSNSYSNNPPSQGSSSYSNNNPSLSSYSNSSSYYSPNATSYTSDHILSVTPSSFRSYSTTSKPAAKKETFYAVSNGRSNGVYKDWDSCKAQVDGFSSAQYKKFDNLQEANAYIESSKRDHSPIRPRASEATSTVSSYTAPSHQSSAKESYYAVNYANGSSRIFTDWASCKAAIAGKQVTHKKFDNLPKAKAFTDRTDVTRFNLSAEERYLRTAEFLLQNTQRTLQEQQSLPKSVIYTDGSYFPAGPNRGTGGIGVYYGPGDPRNVSERVRCETTDSYTPEVHALEKAMENIVSEITRYKQGHGQIFPKYVISSDNEAAKNVLTQYGDTWTRQDFMKRKEGEKLYEMSKNYKAIKQFYDDNAAIFNDHKFRIEWVKGHSGIDGNEAADELAKRGAYK